MSARRTDPAGDRLDAFGGHSRHRARAPEATRSTRRRQSVSAWCLSGKGSYRDRGSARLERYPETVTVVCAVTAPWALLAVRVYVVVCDGETWTELPITAPRPLIESEVALATVQESVALLPPAKGEIDAGEAVNEEIEGTVALLPANGASRVCRGTSCIAGIVGDPRVVA